MKRLRTTVLSITSAAAFFSGCGAKDAANDTVEPPPEVAAELEAQVVPPPNKTGATIQERLEGAIHPQMTEKLHLFEQTFKRMPETFYEFSGRMMDTVPAAPPGMKYEIDPADKTIKLVKK